MAYNIFERWPFTSFQNLNLDWLMRATKEAVETANEAAGSVGQFDDRITANTNAIEQLGIDMEMMSGTMRVLVTSEQVAAYNGQPITGSQLRSLMLESDDLPYVMYNGEVYMLDTVSNAGDMRFSMCHTVDAFNELVIRHILIPAQSSNTAYSITNVSAGGGGSSANTVTVTITDRGDYVSPQYLSDHSYAEISSAIQNGKAILLNVIGSAVHTTTASMLQTSVTVGGQSRGAFLFLDPAALNSNSPDIHYYVIREDGEIYYLQRYNDLVNMASLFANAISVYPQNLTEAQKVQARENIGCLSDSDLPYVTPEMYGAKGDGVTDDTAAIQAAIDSGASTICFGTGKTYRVSKASNPTLYPDNDAPCVYLHNKQNMTVIGNGALLKVEAHGQGVLEITDSENIRVCDLRVSGHGTFPPIAPNGRGEKGDASGGYYKSGYDWEAHKNNSVDTSQFKGVNGNANTEWGTFGGGYIGNVGIGFLIEDGCRDICLENCSSDGFNYSGFSIGFRGHSDYPYNHNITFRQCVVSGCYDDGFNLLLADGAVIQNCDIEDIGHPDALPADAETPYSYTYADPGYGVTCRKPYTSASRAKNIKVIDSHIKKCVRKGVDSHSADGFLVQNNTIELCYYAGIDLAEGDTESTLTYNTQLIGNLLRYCGLLNGAIRASIYTGNASFNPDDYEINNIIADNILVNCACANYGIIYVRIGKNTRINGNIISGAWALANVASLSGIYTGQLEKASENIHISENEISIPTGKLSYPIHAQNLQCGEISGNIINVHECNTTIYAYGDIVNDVSIIGNVARADVFSVASAFSTTTGAVAGNSFPGDNPLLKDLKGYTVKGSATINSGFFAVTSSAIKTGSAVIIALTYKNGTAMNLLPIVQTSDGKANVYVRNPDESLPANGTIVNYTAIII